MAIVAASHQTKHESPGRTEEIGSAPPLDVASTRGSLDSSSLMSRAVDSRRLLQDLLNSIPDDKSSSMLPTDVRKAVGSLIKDLKEENPLSGLIGCLLSGFLMKPSEFCALGSQPIRPTSELLGKDALSDLQRCKTIGEILGLGVALHAMALSSDGHALLDGLVTLKATGKPPVELKSKIEAFYQRTIFADHPVYSFNTKSGKFEGERVCSPFTRMLFSERLTDFQESFIRGLGEPLRLAIDGNVERDMTNFLFATQNWTREKNDEYTEQVKKKVSRIYHLAKDEKGLAVRLVEEQLASKLGANKQSMSTKAAHKLMQAYTFKDPNGRVMDWIASSVIGGGVAAGAFVGYSMIAMIEPYSLPLSGFCGVCGGLAGGLSAYMGTLLSYVGLSSSMGPLKKAQAEFDQRFEKQMEAFKGTVGLTYMQASRLLGIGADELKPPLPTWLGRHIDRK